MAVFFRSVFVPSRYVVDEIVDFHRIVLGVPFYFIGVADVVACFDGVTRGVLGVEPFDFDFFPEFFGLVGLELRNRIGICMLLLQELIVLDEFKQLQPVLFVVVVPVHFRVIGRIVHFTCINAAVGVVAAVDVQVPGGVRAGDVRVGGDVIGSIVGVEDIGVVQIAEIGVVVVIGVQFFGELRGPRQLARLGLGNRLLLEAVRHYDFRVEHVEVDHGVLDCDAVFLGLRGRIFI